MNSLLTRTAAIFGGVAGVAVTGGGIFYLTSTSKPATNNTPSNNETVIKNKSIDSLLSKKRLLTKNNEDEGKWAIPWKAFKEAHTSDVPTEPWDFDNWTTVGEDATILDSFKTQCVNLGKQKVSGIEDPVFVEVEKYCTTSTEGTGNA